MSITLYGIKNCDTMKKARAWLDKKGIAYEFHDYKVAGIDKAHLTMWCAKLGWEQVLNRAGTTFCALPDIDKTNLSSAKAITLMHKQPSMIKRPIIDTGKHLLAGFKPEAYAAIFK